MVLSESKNIYVRIFLAVWAVLECLLLAGIAFGWSSFVFIFKDEGIYSNLCDAKNDTDVGIRVNDSDGSEKNGTSGFDTISNLYDADILDAQPDPVTRRYPTCIEQDRRLSLCFTVGVMTYCVFGYVIGQVNYYFGTRLARLISL